MKLIGIAVVTLLSIVTIVQGVVLFGMRKDVAALTERVQQAEGVPAAGDDGRDFRGPRTDEGDDGFRAEPSGRPGATRLPPPRFVPSAAGAAAASGDPLPLPATLDSPESREQLRQFVVAQMEQQREAERQRREQQREEAVVRARETVAKELGLNPAAARKMEEVFTKTQTAMQALRQKMESGQVQRQDMRREFGAVREQYDQEMKSLLGDDGVKKLQDLQRQNPEIARATMAFGGRGGPGGGRGWGGGPPGGGPGGGPPGGGNQAPGQPPAAPPATP